MYISLQVLENVLVREQVDDHTRKLMKQTAIEVGHMVFKSETQRI